MCVKNLQPKKKLAAIPLRRSTYLFCDFSAVFFGDVIVMSVLVCDFHCHFVCHILLFEFWPVILLVMFCHLVFGLSFCFFWNHV